MQSLDQSQPRRILIVDDNSNIHDDYRKVLSRHEQDVVDDPAASTFFGESLSYPRSKHALDDVEIDSAMQGRQGLQMVKDAIAQKRPYSLAFVDIRMPPGWDGMRTISELWKVAPDLQVVVCSAYTDNSFHDICGQLGNTDQLLVLKKPFDAIEVYQIAVAMTEKWALGRRARFRQEELEELVEARTDEIRKASLVDPLTGVANRTMFNTSLDAALKQTRRYKTLSGLILIDVDFFKQVNDTLGHPAGDALLGELASRLRVVARDTDTVARLGGDEFGIVVTRASKISTFHNILDRIESEIKKPFKWQGQQLDVTFSIGVAVANQNCMTAEEIMQCADLALYRSKKNGRNSATFYEEQMNREILKVRRIQADLAKGLVNDQFVLHYQPIFACQSQELVEFECLIRWNHPEQGLLMPGSFLQVAEESGLIVDIGKWTLQHGLEVARNWPEHIKLAVNVSPIQFRPRNDIFATVMGCLEELNVRPDRLELEITETVLLQDIDLAAKVIRDLRAAGVSVALDDFGVGHSSLNYLKNLPFDKVKLDRSFVMMSKSCSKSRAILQSVASLGKDLGIVALAEGIENEDQLELVTKAGFSQVQGYLMGRPTADYGKYFTEQTSIPTLLRLPTTPATNQPNAH